MHSDIKLIDETSDTKKGVQIQYPNKYSGVCCVVGLVEAKSKTKIKNNQEEERFQILSERTHYHRPSYHLHMNRAAFHYYKPGSHFLLRGAALYMNMRKIPRRFNIIGHIPWVHYLGKTGCK